MQFIQNNWTLILIMVVSGAMLLWPLVGSRFSSVKAVGTLPATVLINTRNALIIDVSEPKEFEGRKLPNALHIPLSQLASRGGEIAKLTTRPVIAYAARGDRSRFAARPLKKLGFTEIYTLSGGLKAWVDAGLPLDKSA